MDKKYVYNIVPVTIIAFLNVMFFCFVLRLNNNTDLNGVTLAAIPTDTSIERIMDGSFQTEFGEYLSDNFYGHTDVVKCHNQIEYGVFEDGSGDIVQGKDGYLFSGSQTYSYVAGEKANAFSWDDYLTFADSVGKMQRLLSEQGKDFVYLLTPTKAEIYPDFLPWNLRMSAAMPRRS